MGAWGTGIFDDDTAMDFLNELTDSKDPLKLMKSALEDARAAKYLEYDGGQSALVASAITDAILNETSHAVGLEELDNLLAKHKGSDVSSLKSLASAAVRQVLSEGSELRELWAENVEDYPKWRANLESLASRGDGHYTSPRAIDHQGAIEIYSPVFELLDGCRSLYLCPLSQKIDKSLGLDGRPWLETELKRSEFHSPLCNPPSGITIMKYIFDRETCNHQNWMRLEVVY